MAVDAESVVVRLLRKIKELAAHAHSLVEFGSIQVVGGEAAKHGVELRESARLVQHRERTTVRLLDFLRVSAEREESSRKARCERDLLLDAIGRRRDGGQDSEEILRQRDCRDVPPARVMKHPEGAEELVELGEVAGADPELPCGEEISDLSLEFIQ